VIDADLQGGRNNLTHILLARPGNFPKWQILPSVHAPHEAETQHRHFNFRFSEASIEHNEK
jgi:hypothetical protein